LPKLSINKFYKARQNINSGEKFKLTICSLISILPWRFI